MVQSRVCCYYKENCSHASLEPTTFLSLPEEVRHRIYQYAGLPTAAPVWLGLVDGSLSFWAGLAKEYPELEDEIWFYYDLREVSRGVRADVVKCLVLNNNVVLDAADLVDEPLNALLSSSLRPLNWIRRLTVVLCCSYDLGIGSKKHCHLHGKSHPCDGFDSDPTTFQSTLAGWEKLVSHLVAAPNLEEMELNLISDIADGNVGMHILDFATRNNFDVAKCNIRLKSERSLLLESIAQLTALAVTSTVQLAAQNTTSQGHFPFLSLPIELRQHILSFTDLVVPSREIVWRKSGFYVDDSRFREEDGCLSGDFCSRQYSVSKKCACWHSPTALFLVSWDFLHDARSIFYSFNRFIIDPGYELEDQQFRRELFEASVFFTQIVPRDSLAHLRDVEIIFDGKGYRSLGISEWILQDWRRVIKYIAPHLTKMSLKLYLGHRNGPGTDLLHVKNLMASFNALFRVHQQIVRPLSHLRCLHDFIVIAWSPFDLGNRHLYNIRPFFWQHEEKMGALVVGSRYEGMKERAAQRRKSEWCFWMSEPA